MSKPGKKDVPQSTATEPAAGSRKIENVGNHLRTLRIEKGLSISDVCEATRISETNLNAMEDRNFSALPADTFVRGLLTIYAKFLGQDPVSIVSIFMEERDLSQQQGKRPRTTRQTKKILTPKKMAEPAHVSSVSMAGILLLIIVLIFTGFCLYTSWNPFSSLVRESDSLQSVVMDMMPASTSEKTEITDLAAMSGQPLQDPASGDTGYTVTVRFLSDTGIVMIRDDGAPIQHVYRKGDEQTWNADSSLTMTFANPASGEILVNNIPVSFPEGQEGSFTLHIPADLTAAPPAND